MRSIRSLLLTYLKNRRRYLFEFVFFCAGALVVGFLWGSSQTQDRLSDGFDSFVELRLGALNGDLTNPVLECKEGLPIAIEKEDFRRELDSFVERIERQNGISRIGVSFRDLNNGPSFGIDRDAPFLPASLLKVPVMISFLKKSEAEPKILDKKITFEYPKLQIAQLFPPEVELVPGTTYSVRELIERMIKYSDNEALLLLVDHLPLEEEENLYGLLGMDIQTIRAGGGAMSVREYSSFFRILFNSSFLSRKNSEYALSLLLESTFEGGLRRGVPDNIKIARKFGERELGEGKQHFHDCGIVYYPQHPYLLCVMTQGNSIGLQMEAITSISSFVYTKIAEQYPQ